MALPRFSLYHRDRSVSLPFVIGSLWMSCTKLFFGSVLFALFLVATVGISLLAGDWSSLREEIVSDVIIKNNHSVVWDVLLNTDLYVEWNSVVSNVVGEVTPESQLKVLYYFLALTCVLFSDF
jgi:hypothetical protein